MKRLLLAGASAILGLALAVPTFAHEAGQWIVRGGIGTVMPKSDNLSLPTLEDLSVPEVSSNLLTISSVVQVDDGTSLTLSLTYMFTENWAFDVLAAWPFKHDVDLDASIIDGSTTTSASVPFGEV
ncbi:MAG: OmpW family protein, partial [Woeseiaceae bacterium]|nr:OmpW family protein [Woeseiaceae bacterium]